jgi:hypothetical protein
MKPQRQSLIGVTKYQAFLLGGPDYEACFASETRQSQIG